MPGFEDSKVPLEGVEHLSGHVMVGHPLDESSCRGWERVGDPKVVGGKGSKVKASCHGLGSCAGGKAIPQEEGCLGGEVCCTGEARWQLRTVLLNCRREKAQGKDCCIKVKCWQERASARMLASELTHTRIKLMWCCKHREKITWKSTWV